MQQIQELFVYFGRAYKTIFKIIVFINPILAINYYCTFNNRSFQKNFKINIYYEFIPFQFYENCFHKWLRKVKTEHTRVLKNIRDYITLVLYLKIERIDFLPAIVQNSKLNTT
jgi:hypothetical protein